LIIRYVVGIIGQNISVTKITMLQTSLFNYVKVTIG